MTENQKENIPETFFLEGTVESFSGKSAHIVISENQKVVWPISNLPGDCEVGSKVRLKLSTAQTDEEERTGVAKAILNQILKEKE
jgi:hypothetical protein